MVFCIIDCGSLLMNLITVIDNNSAQASEQFAKYTLDLATHLAAAHQMWGL